MKQEHIVTLQGKRKLNKHWDDAQIYDELQQQTVEIVNSFTFP